MEIRDLRFFCVTADLEHVTQAADQLGVSQPFLTRIIGQLEKETGTPLFDNVGRKIKLNSFGEAFYPLAKKALSEFDNIRVEMERLLDRHENTVTLLANSEGYSSEFALDYNMAHPQHSLSVSYASRHDIIDALIAGDADFAFCVPAIPDDPVRGLVTENVFHEYVGILLPPGHPLLARKTLAFADLEDLPLVASLKGSGIRIGLELAFDKYNFHPPIACETNDPNLVVRMVMRGLGFAVMPRSSMLLNPQVRDNYRPLDLPEGNALIGMTYNINSPAGRDAAEFLEFIRNFFKRRELEVAKLL